MKIRKIIKNIDKKNFLKYAIFSIIFIVNIFLLSTFNITEAKYETDTRVKIAPSIAFFVVDVGTQVGSIKLESMIPRTDPYLYTFNVSNFNSEKKTNVDLTYSIEIITTTNMPLNFRIFKGNDLTSNQIDADTFTTDENGMYYRHLVIDDISSMPYSQYKTDVYTLWVEFPLENKNNPDSYQGVIDLIDIKIDAEQVV